MVLLQGESCVCISLILRCSMPFLWGVVKGTFGTFGTAKSLALDEILG